MYDMLLSGSFSSFCFWSLYSCNCTYCWTSSRRSTTLLFNYFNTVTSSCIYLKLLLL